VRLREGPIEEPIARREPRRHCGTRSAVSFTAVAWLAVLAMPSAAPAQADYSGPGVVPPSRAYVGGSDGHPETALPRWRTDMNEDRVIRVYFTDPPPGRPGFWNEVARAIEAWNEIGGVPIVFNPTVHASAADVKFRWIRRFEAHQAGTTDWETDGDGWLSSAVVTLATEHEDGTPMSDEFLGLVAIHELGHVVGLPHSDDPGDVMHAGNRNFKLSDRDIQSARQLYGRLESPQASEP